MNPAAARASRRVGATAGLTMAVLCLAYAVVLAVGLLSLPSPVLPIQDPWFTLMELLILAIAPTMVVFTVGLHAWASPQHRPAALLSVVFMGMCAALTCAVHFAVLVLSRQPSFAGADWAALVFSFKWPSLAYAWDILAWDVFFPIGALFAALAVSGTGPARVARGLLFGSAGLAAFGLVGVPTGDMQLRNVGIIGYVVCFPAAAVLLALAFRRAEGQGAA